MSRGSAPGVRLGSLFRIETRFHGMFSKKSVPSIVLLFTPTFPSKSGESFAPHLPPCRFVKKGEHISSIPARQDVPFFHLCPALSLSFSVDHLRFVVPKPLVFLNAMPQVLTVQRDTRNRERRAICTPNAPMIVLLPSISF